MTEGPNTGLKRLKHALVVFMVVLGGCDPSSAPPVRIGINPWPGYEFLYLAQKKGFLEEEGAHVQIVEYGSLGDVRRAYMRGQIDAMASTAIEVLQVCAIDELPCPVIFFVTDYSNGADVVLARAPIAAPSDLTGRVIGAEPQSLGYFLAIRAIQTAGLDISDVTIRPLDPVHMADALRNGDIDAAVAYPPYAADIDAIPGVHPIFDSGRIPREVVDVLSVTPEVHAKRTADLRALLRAWDRAVAYAEEHPEDAYRIMAQREHLEPEVFAAMLQDIQILRVADQAAVHETPPTLRQTLTRLAALLHTTGQTPLRAKAAVDPGLAGGAYDT